MFIWTKTKPTKPGFYWRQDFIDSSAKPKIIELRKYCGKLCEMNWEPDWNKYLWSGPIPEPINNHTNNVTELTEQSVCKSILDICYNLIRKQNIKTIRKSLGMTQTELAAHIGVHPSTISNYELGYSKCPKRIYEQIVQMVPH